MQAEDIRPANPEVEQRKVAPPPSEGFLQRVMSFFSGEGDPTKERKRLLKEIAKQLKGVRYKFYKPKTGEALPAMARFFYEIYSVVGPAQALVSHAETSGTLKTIIIEGTFSQEQLDLKAYLNEEAIRERAGSMDTKDLAADLKEKLISYFAHFDAQKVKEINSAYELLSVFLDLVHFDYYFFLKKFDALLPEQDFKYMTRFEQINGEYVVEDLKDFLSIVYLIDPAADWDFLFRVLAEYRGVEVVSRSEWPKMLRAIGDVRKSRVLELIVRHADHDPFFKAKVVPFSENIVEEYLNRLKSQAEIMIQKIIRENQTKKIATLTKAVFGTSAVSRMKYYTEKANTLFAQRMLGGYIYVAPLNYLKAFLLDYFKKDIREIVDLLLVRGRWSTPLMSQQLSESYHVLLQVSDELLAFDESLADEADTGIQLRGLIRKADRDKAAVKLLRQSVKEINDSALAMVQRAAQSLIVMAKNFKIVLEDHAKPARELITNWKEIETASDGKIQGKIVGAYKQIYLFIQLLQGFAKKEA